VNLLLGIVQVLAITTIADDPSQLVNSDPNVVPSLYLKEISYCVICEPPFHGAVHETVTSVSEN